MTSIKKPLSYLLFIFVLLFCSRAIAEVEQDSTLGQVSQTFQQWVEAVNHAKGDPTRVLTFYADNAVLMPAFSEKVMKTQNEREAYLKKFTAYKNITVAPQIFMVQDFGDIAVASGTYTFYYLGKRDRSEKVHARFTIVYKKDGDKWMIVNFQSSKLPKVKK